MKASGLIVALTAILVLLSQAALADNYKVISIKGNCQVQDGKSEKTGKNEYVLQIRCIFAPNYILIGKTVVIPTKIVDNEQNH